MVADILSSERISSRRLARSLGVQDSTVHRWVHSQCQPSRMARITLKLIRKYGLNAVLSGDLSQSVENQGKDAMQGSEGKVPKDQ